MILENSFPLVYYMNLGLRQDRRAFCEEQFERHRIRAKRFPAVNGRWVRNQRGMSSQGRYACGLTQRLIIRTAKLAGAQAVLVFEDDVVLHENFRELASAIELPEDWGIFYFGCQHVSAPTRHGRGVVRVRRALDMHAFAVNSLYFEKEPVNCIFSRIHTHPFAECVNIVCANSVEFLKGAFARKFDVLYLDSLDRGAPGCAEHALEEAISGMVHVASRGLIAFDDTNWERGRFAGKGALAVPMLIEKGWGMVTIQP